MSGIKNVFGGFTIQTGWALGDSKDLHTAFDVLEKGDTKIIDTAAIYGDSETVLGSVDAGKRFIIDTKAGGGFRGEKGGSKEQIASDAASSQEKLKTTVDVYYIHAPDSATPLEESVEAVNEVYKKGFFKRFGLSNFQATDVQKVYDICKAKGYVLPTVYQGNYSPVTRRQEEVLFPTLKKLGISFYAYSPLAGGFLAKTKEQIEEGVGRFDPSTDIGKLYIGLYSKPSYLKALELWDNIAKEEGVTKADLAYRWVKYSSPLKPEQGDAIIIGASRLQQLEQTLSSLSKGPLSDRAVKRIDEVWETVKHEAPLDNYHREAPTA